ncbi:MAG: class I SAM-dependent methyltransferase [Gemmatimonadaceae bacterium]
MDRKRHWEDVYAVKGADEMSWYQARPERSLELLAAVGAGPASAVLDVGGGDSTLVDALVERGFTDVTVLDISAAALARARTRLGPRATGVRWVEADVARANLPPAGYDVWHDRALFHFLTSAGDRASYASAAADAVRPGGALIVATFATDGPTRCSGLDVVRYDAAGLARQFADAFEPIGDLGDVHLTPAGAEQRFTYATFRRR